MSFLEVNNTCADVFGIIRRFLENFLENQDLVCSAAGGKKTALGILELWFNYFAEFFFKALRTLFVREAKERDAPVVRGNLSYFLCMGSGMINPVCQYFGGHPQRQWHLPHTF